MREVAGSTPGLDFYYLTRSGKLFWALSCLLHCVLVHQSKIINLGQDKSCVIQISRLISVSVV
jgi:hypothetical protein